MLRVAICDDDIKFCSYLEKELSILGMRNGIPMESDQFYCGEILYRRLCEGSQYDVILLDIELNGMNGVEVGKRIRTELMNDTVQIVYISAIQSYAMELFDIRPFNFLIKPIGLEKLQEVIINVCRVLEKTNQLFEYQIGHAVHKIPLIDILYFESEEKKVKIISKKTSVGFYAKLQNIQKQLNDYGFISIHKSYLVNYQHIIRFEYDKVTMSNEDILPISQRNRKQVRKIQLEKRRDQP